MWGMAQFVRSRAAVGRVAASFAAQGLGFSVMVTNTAANKQRFAFDDTTIAVLALAVCVGAFLGTRVAAAVARRAGSLLSLRVGLLLSAVGLGLFAVVWLPSLRIVAIQLTATAIYSVGLGMVDAATNMRAIALQESSGRRMFVALHSVASAASIAGALLVSAIVAGGGSAGLGFAVAAAMLFVVLGLAGRETTPAPASSSPHSSGIPAAVMALLALGVLAAPAADSLVSSWGAIFLAELLVAPAAIVPLGYAAYIAALVIARLAGDWIAARLGLGRALAGSIALGALGLLLLSVSTTWPLALAAFALIGAGFGVVVPLVLMLAARLARARLAPESSDAEARHAVDNAVAATNGFVYAGYVLSTVLVGAVAGFFDLRVAIVAVLVLVLPAAAVLPIARRQDSTANSASSSRPRSPSLG